MKYRRVVTLKRTNVVITCWVVFTVSSSVRLCSDPITTSRYSNIVVPLCLVTSIFCYTKIFFTLRHHQSEIQDHIQQTNQTNQLNVIRHRKAVFTAMRLPITLVACYLPQVIPVTLIIHSEWSPSVALAWSYAFTLVFLNSSLNSILYSSNMRSGGNSEGHNQPSVSLLIEVALLELYYPLAYRKKIGQFWDKIVL